MMNMPKQSNLPTAFAALEGFVPDWSLATESARKEKRATASTSEIQNYYDALKPQIPAIANYLDRFDYSLEKLPLAERNLLWLAYMYMETAMVVEFYHHHEPDAEFQQDRFKIVDTHF